MGCSPPLSPVSGTMSYGDPEPVGVSMPSPPTPLSSECTDGSSEGGTLRNVVSLNGSLMLIFLGIESDSIRAWALSSPAYRRGISLAWIMVGIIGPRTHPLRPLLAEIGVLLVELLGPNERGLVNMARAAGTFRWGVQFALYDYWGREPEPSHATSQQSTSSDGYSFSDSHRTGNSVEGTSIGTFTGVMYVDDAFGQPAPDEPSELDHQIASATAFLTQQGLDKTGSSCQKCSKICTMP